MRGYASDFQDISGQQPLAVPGVHLRFFLDLLVVRGISEGNRPWYSPNRGGKLIEQTPSVLTARPVDVSRPAGSCWPIGMREN